MKISEEFRKRTRELMLLTKRAGDELYHEDMGLVCRLALPPENKPWSVPGTELAIDLANPPVAGDRFLLRSGDWCWLPGDWSAQSSQDG